MRFSLSSAIHDAAILAPWCVALAKQQMRLAKWWDIEPWDVAYAPGPGLADDPEGIDVQIVASLPDAPQDVAYHTVRNGRPLCLISWAAVQAEGGSLTGPNGLVSAISHEMVETKIDAPCTITVTNPDGDEEPEEVADRLQGTDYEEDGSPGIFLANAGGPDFFRVGATRAAGLDIASDLHGPTATTAFWLAPGGYYVPVGKPAVYGRHVSAMARARIDRTGPRGGKRRAA